MQRVVPQGHDDSLEVLHRARNGILSSLMNPVRLARPNSGKVGVLWVPGALKVTLYVCGELRA